MFDSLRGHHSFPEMSSRAIGASLQARVLMSGRTVPYGIACAGVRSLKTSRGRTVHGKSNTHRARHGDRILPERRIVEQTLAGSPSIDARHGASDDMRGPAAAYIGIATIELMTRRLAGYQHS